MTESSAPSTPLLRVEDLTVSAGDNTLVHPVSFAIARGERVGLIGESGSGKSLTSSAIMGLLSPELTAAGSITLNARGESGQVTTGNLLQTPERQRARLRGSLMSMVFQEPMSALNPLVRVGAQVAEAMTLHGASAAEARDRALALLTDVRLPDPQAAMRAYPHQLSGGQRQRVVLAIAMANSPQLLICDEPTTALDVTVQAQVLSLITEAVSADDTGLLFITHDLVVVAQVCQRVLVMNKGELVEEGTVSQVFTNPVHPYTRGLLAASDLTAVDDHGRLFTIATAGEYEGVRASGGSSEAGAGAAGAAGAGAQTEPGASGAGAPEGDRASGAVKGEAAHGGSPLITVSDLTKVYRRTRTNLFKPADTVPALSSVSFRVTAGEHFGIVGESGSGKSTLLKILAGLETATSGSAHVDGIEVVGAASRDLRTMREDVQIVFQDPYASLDPRMKIVDIVAEPLVAAGLSATERRERARAVLIEVGIEEDSIERYPHQFSGGQRQRISIARALVVRPRILIADEPVSALDVSVRAQVLNLLTDLAADYGLTLVFVSHDLGVVRHLCREIIVMKDGRIVEAGEVEQIYDAPAHPYTQGLVAATPDLTQALKTAHA